mgnify:CR=1 FL=1
MVRLGQVRSGKLTGGKGLYLVDGVFNMMLLGKLVLLFVQCQERAGSCV